MLFKPIISFVLKGEFCPSSLKKKKQLVQTNNMNMHLH